MPIQDTVIPEQNLAIQDTAIPDTGNLSGSSERVEDFKAMKSAHLDNYNTGVPVAEGYLRYRGAVDKDLTLTQLSVQKAELDNTAISEAYEEQVLADPDIFMETAPLIVEMQDETVRTATDSTKQFVDAVARDLDEGEQAALTNQVKLWEMLQPIAEDITKFEIGMDLAKSFIPFRDTFNEFGLLGSVFGNEEKMQQIVLEFKSKTFEEQQDMFPALRDELLEELGPILGIDTLTKFLEPVSEDELDAFGDVWKVFDVIDIATAGASILGKVALFGAAFNLPKILKKANNAPEAGDSTASALTSDEAAAAMQMQRETAFGNAVPYDTSIEDIGHTPNISTEALAGIEKFFEKADKTVEDIMLGNGYTKEGILNTVERAAVETATFKRLNSARHENVQIKSKTENTTTFSYKAKDDDGNLFDDEYVLSMSLDDVGQWNQDQLSVLGEFIASPTVLAKGLTRLDVRTAERLDEQTAKVFNDLAKLQTEALKPLGSLLRPKNKQRLAGVDKALREGDEFKNVDGTRGKLFNVDELKGQYHFDEEQTQAYYNTNRLYNNLWRLRNNSKREEMIAFNFKQVDLLDGEYSYGKSFDTPLSAKTALVEGKTANVFDSVDDVVTNNISEAFLEEQYALGKTLVRLGDPYQTGAGRGKFNYVLVNTEAVRALPSTVLTRKTAYVPKVSKDGYWFVKEFGTDVIDGVPKSGQFLKTLRYFDNKDEAEVFTRQLRQKAIDTEGLTESQAASKYKNLEDREQELVATATGNFSHGSGGLYTGVRAEDDILFGLNGDEGKRINAYEALSRNIANVSRLMPINQWRLGLEQRWLNSANQMLDVPIEHFGPLPSSVESSRKGQFLNKMASQIRDWQGFPAKEEQIYNAVNQRLYEWSLLKDGVRRAIGSKVTGWMRDKDPISGARAAAFHSLLGWFNPAQLWVQAQGMAVAVSINLGKNLTETLRHTTGLTILGQADVVQGTKRFQLAAKAAGMGADELEEIHKLWKKTGLEDSILQTADHAASMRGHGIAMDALSRAADKGLFFYRHGEFLNRRMAFTSALDDLKAGRLKRLPDFKKGMEINDEVLKIVLDRTNDLLLNITKANRAWWQKGIMSVPTQFFQVSAKALETAIGANDNLTKAERMRVLAGQVALYGTAGIPLVNLGTNYAMEALDVTQEDIDNNPVLTKTWNDGFWGFTTLGIFGVDVEVSKRGSLVRGVTEFVDNWMFSESTAATKLMGAFGATQQRFWDSFTRQMAPITVGAFPTDIIDIIKLPTLPFLETISTWRNGEKAVFMQSIDAILDKHGDPSVQRGFEIRESVMAAIGFQLTDETTAWTLKERTQHVLDANKKKADIIINRMNEVSIREAQGRLTDEYLEDTKQLYASVYASVDPNRQSDIMNSIQSRLKRDDKQTRAINQYIKKVYGSTTDGLSLIRDGLLGTSIVNVLPEEGEE